MPQKRVSGGAPRPGSPWSPTVWGLSSAQTTGKRSRNWSIGTSLALGFSGGEGTCSHPGDARWLPACAGRGGRREPPTGGGCEPGVGGRAYRAPRGWRGELGLRVLFTPGPSLQSPSWSARRPAASPPRPAALGWALELPPGVGGFTGESEDPVDPSCQSSPLKATSRVRDPRGAETTGPHFLGRDRKSTRLNSSH